jgi:hypothetical protein
MSLIIQRKYILYILVLFAFCGFGQKKTTKASKKKTDKGNFFTNHKPSSRDFHSYGNAILTDFSLFPISKYPSDKLTFDDTLPIFSRIRNYNLYHISYFFRYNIFQPDDEKAITVALNPGLGIGFSQSKRVDGFGIFNGSMLLGFEWGAGATYRSIEEKGFFIRAGAEYNYAPLVVFSTRSVDNDVRTYISPIVSVGMRRQNLNGKLFETNLKIGWGSETVDESNGISPYMFSSPFSFRFSVVVFLDH